MFMLNGIIGRFLILRSSYLLPEGKQISSVLSYRSLLLIYQFKVSLFLLSLVFLRFFLSVPSCLLLYR